MMSGEVLYMDGGIVKLTEEGLSLGSFSALYESDKNTGKPLFKRYIDAIWHVYSKSSPYYSLSFDMRVDEYDKKCLNKGDKLWVSCIGDKRFVACVQEYDKVTKTNEDRQYQRLIDDAQKYIEYLERIPLEKTVREKVEVENPETKEKEFRFVEMKVPNFKERKEARNEIEEQYKFIDKIKERIAGQTVNKNRKYVRIFDNPEG